MGKEPMISLGVHPDKMKNKNYDVGVVALATLDCGWLGNGKNRKIGKTEFRARLRTVLGMTNYKIKVVVNTLMDLRVMDEDDDCYVINAVEAPFVRLNVSTVRFCLENLDSLSFKVYCYLANKFNMHRTYGITENYFFSVAELISVIGYGRNHQSHIKVVGILKLLEGIGLIQCGEESVGRPGQHGTYRELYRVNEVTSDTLGVDMLEDDVDISLEESIPACYDGVWHEGVEYDSSMLEVLEKYPKENYEYLKYYNLLTE